MFNKKIAIMFCREDFNRINKACNRYNLHKSQFLRELITYHFLKHGVNKITNFDQSGYSENNSLEIAVMLNEEMFYLVDRAARFIDISKQELIRRVVKNFIVNRH